MGYRQIGNVFIISNEQDMIKDKQIDILWKAINKQGRYIENLEKMVASLNKDSHPPIFKKSQYENLLERLEVVEAFIDNIELIEKGEQN